MKGVVLAGGLGTRLRPLTDITNKHLLPVYDKPMIFYPLEMLAKIGITEVMIVVGGHSTGEIIRLCGDGSRFGLRLAYAYQMNEGGIAQALSLAQGFIGHGEFCVVLGDNVFENGIKYVTDEWAVRMSEAHVLLAGVDNPKAFGVPEFQEIHGRPTIVQILEKPLEPKSNFAVTGVYFYTQEVFKLIEKSIASDRGELEISDINNEYAKKGLLSYSIVKGWWGDAGGSVDGMYEVTNLVRKTGANK